ncbi:MurR/RpiR family transcriptional regulator [Paracoccus spongiarum]|uniref:MurR/RpiR family transcriptional regulator n=1 Tax=Paracoccus spongiarum TaxID=3064387 RepID=A0ABT9JCN0_9RHOB|nr:MurR/RpiR family transcriptional regulator [Paracoccus sp. 2205BS29-5]MDP5306871.1 MurR/RpiR family transcriptional regulator [Paracoccus sp. 2205BS29-5]
MDGGAPHSTDEFIARLQELHGSLPKRLRQCAEYAARQQARLAQATVAEFARGAGVPASAVVRFSQAMGFSGYSQMRDLFRSPFQMPRPDYAQRLQQLSRQGAARPAGLLAEFTEAGRLSLERMLDTVDGSDFDRAAGMLARAGVIHVVGHGRCFAAAAHTAYILERVEVPALLHGAFGQISGVTSVRGGDAVLAISFSPPVQETLDFCAEAQRAGAQVVAIADPGVAARLGSGALCLNLIEVEAAGFRPMTATSILALALAAATGGLRALGQAAPTGDGQAASA